MNKPEFNPADHITIWEGLQDWSEDIILNSLEDNNIIPEENRDPWTHDVFGDKFLFTENNKEGYKELTFNEIVNYIQYYLSKQKFCDIHINPDDQSFDIENWPEDFECPEEYLDTNITEEGYRIRIAYY